MGQRERRGIDHGIAHKEQVDVDGAVGIPAVDTLAGTAQVALDALCDGKQSLTPEQFDALASAIRSIIPFAAKEQHWA